MSMRSEQRISRRAQRPCVEPGCPALAKAGRPGCEAHERQRERAYNLYERPERHRFYLTKEWRALSKQVLAEQPYCSCGAKATQSDHILSIKERPDLALDRGNLVGLCKPCHSRKTAQKEGRWRAEGMGRGDKIFGGLRQ